jgi:N-acylglucosamine-6-phosphate 2-epimerase
VTSCCTSTKHSACGLWRTSRRLSRASPPAASADVVGSAIEGYERAETRSPNIELVEALTEWLDCPVISERYFMTPTRSGGAMEARAHAVIVGSAIVDRTLTVRRFAEAVC